jgi:hypothetical protein
MGSSGWSIDIEARDGKTPCTWAEVREATLDFLWEAWRDALPRSLLDEAWGWVSLGEDSLLTLGDPHQADDQPADCITFWFYLSVEWPSELAQHWLHMALASKRQRFEQVLEDLGYRLAEQSNYPELGDNRYRFIAVDERIGLPSKEGIYWALPTHAWQLIDACNPLERERAAAVVDGGPCQCPMCMTLALSR